MTPDTLTAPRPAVLREQALASTAATPLIVTPRPFARADEVQLRHAPEGLTVLAMVELMEGQGVLDPALRELVRVTAGDQLVPQHLWASARPKAGVTLFVDVTPMKGSNPLRTILQIAVVALATFVGAAIGGPWGAVAAAAITVGGTLLINALVPIPQPKGPDARQERYSLDGASNRAVPHDPVPIVLGRRRIFPKRAANWYTTTIANTVYLRQLFQPSVGWVERESPRIGQTDLASYLGVTARWNTKPTDGLDLLYFTATPAEDNLGALPVKASSGWVTRGAPIKCDRLSLDIAVLNGLFNTKESSGSPINRSVSFEIRYGLRGVAAGSATAAPVGVSGVVTWTRDDIDAYRQEFAWDVALGEYDVHVRRLTADNTDIRAQDELSWICLRAFRDEAPIRHLDGVPWIELELQATDQLNGIPDNFNFVATSVVPQATAMGPGSYIATRNPADLFLAAAYAPFSDLDLDADERRFSAIADWRALCAAQDWKCDLVEEGETSVGELLQRVAACGRARPAIDFGALTVVVDWEKPLVRQMFTPRTVRNFRGELLYPEDVHGLRLRFQNEDKDYLDDTITVFAPGYDEDTASRYDSMEVRDKCDPDEVEWEGARVVGERIARPESFTFEQDVEHIMVAEGDRAWLMHHVALIGQVSARVLGLVEDPTDGVGLRLDEPVTMEAGKAYDLRWRSATPDPITGLAPFTAALKSKAGERHVVYFEDAEPAALPALGDLVAIGEHLVEVLDVVVQAIRPKPGLMAELTCIPYAPELMEVGDTPITSYRSAASIPPQLPGAYMPPRDVPRLTSMVVTATQIGRSGWDLADQAWSDGILDPGEKRTWIPLIQALLDAEGPLRAEADELDLTVAASSAERIAYETAAADLDALLASLDTPVPWDDSSGNTTIDDPTDFKAVFQAIQLAQVNLQTAIQTSVRVRTGITDTVAPDPPSSLAVIGAFQSLFLSWINAADDDLDKVEVWESLVDDQPDPSTELSKRIATTAVRPGSIGAWARTGLSPGDTRYYWLRSIDRSGNVSGFNAVPGVRGDTLSLGYIDFGTGIKPVGSGNTLPSPAATYPGDVFYLETDQKLYRKDAAGTGWVVDIAAADITGQLTDAQIAALAASKVTGQLTDAQLAAIAAAKLTGQITSTQITDGSISTPKLAAGAVTANEIAANTITAAKIAAATITATELAAGSVTTAKLVAGAVTATEIAAGAITTAKITALAVTAAELAANAVTATKIAAGVITASHIAAATITGTQIAAGTITAANIVAGTLTADRLQTGTITANEIAAATITAAKIVGGAITTVTWDEQVYNANLTGSAVQVFSTSHTTTEAFAAHVIHINANVINSGAAVGCLLTVKRDGSPISVRSFVAPANFTSTGSFMLFDQPNSGAHTYSIDANSTSGSGASGLLELSNMVIMELKR